MISTILEAASLRVLHNRAGANLVSGLTATTLMASTWAGQMSADLALFETDEAAFPQALRETQPRLVLIHNLFRDQLDRYGEVDTVARHWHSALKTLPSSATVVLNADDPAVADLAEGLQARVVFYGLDDLRYASDATAHIADAQFCRRCGARYVYEPAFFAHIGHYHCPNCGHSRPMPQVHLMRIDAQDEGSRLALTWEGGAMEVLLPLPGLYNAMNAAAAVAVGLQLGVPAQTIRAALETFHAAFGRLERIKAANGTPMLIALIKNPVGASEAVRMVVSTLGREHALDLFIVINDRFADGTDVSWLWDADFEALTSHIRHVTVSGTRATDMAVRLKYAGVDPAIMRVHDDLGAALDDALSQIPAGRTLAILPTYTAMLELRAELVRRGWARPFWQE